MFKLTTPTSLPLLNLPASALEALSNEILGPVDDIDLFTAFWNETETLLWHLNHDDTLPEDPLLAVALANPEYVTALDDGWYLLLGIVCDNGQGIYLVLPRASENVQSCCTSGLIDGEIPDKNGWLSAGVALSLLQRPLKRERASH